MFLYRFLICFTFLFINISLNAQNLIDLINKNKKGYKIEGEISGLKDSTVMLAYYFGGKQYATDTANVINEKFIFKGDKELKGGMYLVVLSDQRYFDVIISEQYFSFKTDLNDLIGSMEFKNSRENSPFYEYINFISIKRKDANNLQEKLKNSKNQQKSLIEKKLEKINNDVNQYKNNFLKNYKDIFFCKIIKATTEIEIPEAPLDSTGNPNKNFAYQYYKKHFWDNIDFSDSRMLRTPIFYNKLDQYLEKLTFKHPDSINVSADIIIDLARANDEMFQYVVSYITSTYERSKVMGMDAVFVHMVEKYYITKQCDWVDSTQLVKIADRAQKIAPNLIGRKAAEFIDYYGRPFMKDTSGVAYKLSDVNAEYTIVVFYGPTCGHCKKEIPKLKQDIDSLQNLNYDIKVFSIATEFDKKEWKKFIANQKIGNWINVADIGFDDEGNPVASSDWRDKYDIYSTPVIYLLDKDKKIIAKRITHNQVVDIITRINQKKS